MHFCFFFSYLVKTFRALPIKLITSSFIFSSQLTLFFSIFFYIGNRKQQKFRSTIKKLTQQKLTKKLTKKRKKSSIDRELEKVLTDAGLVHFKSLFKLYGINCITDLEFLHKDALESLQVMVRENQFILSVDLQDKFNQINYLGKNPLHGKLENYEFSPIDRKKILEKLPIVVSEHLEKKKHSSFGPTKRLKE